MDGLAKAEPKRPKATLRRQTVKARLHDHTLVHENRHTTIAGNMKHAAKSLYTLITVESCSNLL